MWTALQHDGPDHLGLWLAPDVQEEEIVDGADDDGSAAMDEMDALEEQVRAPKEMA